MSDLRGALRVGAVCLGLGVLGWSWELLASQAASSPWHVAGIPSVAARFALHAWLEGLALFALAPAAARGGLFAQPGRARAWLAALIAGTALVLGALAYAARTGVLGVQLRDNGSEGHGVMLVRLAGQGLLLAVLIAGGVRAMRGAERDATNPTT